MYNKNTEGKIQKHIPIISEITGLTASILSAHFFGDKDGAMAAGAFVQTSLNDFLNRMLSPRQEQRILTASALAINYIDELLKQGEELRQDGYFSENTVARSDATEVVDSMLFTVGNEEQEKKIPYMAHLIKNAAFDEAISADSACYYLQVFRNLTYRQICMIKLIVQRNNHQLRDKSKIQMLTMGIKETQPNSMEQFFEEYEENLISHEFIDLYNKGYITLVMSHHSDLVDHKTFSMIPKTAHAGMTLFHVYRDMNLEKIPDEDLAPIVKALS